MPAYEISKGVYSVGVINPSLRVFDIVMTTEYGTTYNAYLVKGENKTALIESCHRTYWRHFLNNIKEVCDPKKIDYFILNHNEPDHTGCVENLVELNPDAEIFVTQAGSAYIKNITNNPNLKLHVVKDNETLDLGGKTLKFMISPLLHWPDSMFTWLEESKTLFTCDFLGAHYAEPHVFDYNITYAEKYESAFKGYYDAIFGPFPSYVQKGLEKIKDLDVMVVCPSHGPILTDGSRLNYVKEMYNKWSTPVVKDKKEIPVFYCSAYGYTRQLALMVKEGILSVLPDADVETYDIIKYDMGALAGKLNGSDAFAIGTPTINREAVPPVWILLAHMDAVNCGKKPCLVFGSYGWSGEGVPNIAARLKQLKCNVFGDGMKVAFKPSEEDLSNAKKLGANFAATLK